MLFKAKGWEMNTATEYLGLGQDTDTTNTVNFHLHIGVTVGITKIGKMGSPGGIFGVSFDNDGVFVQRIGQGKGRLGLLPRVQVVRLFAAKPVGQRSPNV